MNIERFLKIRGWNQTELAREIGTSSQNINKWATGKGVPSYEFCRKLIEAGMSVEDLFGVDEYAPFQESKPFSMDEFNERFARAMVEWQKTHPKPGDNGSSAK